MGDDTLEIHWMAGGWTKAWRDLKIRKGRKMIDWIDTISKDTVLLYDIELTKTNRLKATTVNFLKER